MAIPRLRLVDFAGEDQSLHVARYDFRRRLAGVRHRHDFYEAFWVERGSLGHLLNGRAGVLETGDLVLMAPDDEHLLSGRGPQRTSFVNVAMSAGVVERILRRLAQEAAVTWGQGDRPRVYRVTPAARDRLAEIAEVLATDRRDELTTEWFVASLLMLLRGGHGTGGGAEGPAWLAAAVADFGAGNSMALGASGLAELAGRSARHVNRTVQACYGMSATELVNRLRLERAARLLEMTNRPIQQVAADSGFNNLGYFYRRFAQRYASTPHQYRLKRRAIV